MKARTKMIGLVLLTSMAFWMSVPKANAQSLNDLEKAGKKADPTNKDSVWRQGGRENGKSFRSPVTGDHWLVCEGAGE